jgi:hypothetical protein
MDSPNALRLPLLTPLDLVLYFLVTAVVAVSVYYIVEAIIN